jgi:hypothetical protein
MPDDLFKFAICVAYLATVICYFEIYVTVESFGVKQCICYIAGCRVQFPNDLACVLATCDHYSALLVLLTLEFALFFF